MIVTPELQQTLEDLYARYARALDDGPLQDWPGLFTEECSYTIVPRDNYDQNLPLAIMRCESRAMLEDRVAAVQSTIMFEPRYLRHHITNINVTNQQAERLTVTANYSVIEVLTGELPKILSTGRYLDVIVADDTGQHRFAEKQVVYDSVLVPNTIVYPL